MEASKRVPELTDTPKRIAELLASRTVGGKKLDDRAVAAAVHRLFPTVARAHRR